MIPLLVSVGVILIIVVTPTLWRYFRRREVVTTQISSEIDEKNSKSVTETIVKEDVKETDRTEEIGEILTSGEDVEELFKNGIELEKEGHVSLARSCYLTCLKYSLVERLPFSRLAECLQRTAEIHFSLGEYDRALKFLQAAKFLYENAVAQMSGDAPEDRETVLRTLSNEFFQEHKYEMALKYASLAAARKKKLEKGGNSTDVEKKEDLDDFLKTYSLLGRQQYVENMVRYREKEQRNVNEESI